jgi:hypothetical protein
LQYQKPEDYGFPTYRLPFRVRWDKAGFAPKRGDRMWLLSKRAIVPKPKYYIVYRFIADDVAPPRKGNDGYAEGNKGTWYDKAARIDDQSWFPAFLKSMGNFSRGVSPVTDEYLRPFEAVVAKVRVPAAPKAASPSASVPITPAQSGAGFGDFETNREVERAAVAFAAAHFRDQGWKVETVEGQRIGYDLHVQRAKIELHVEVKGVCGSAVSFPMTGNEVKRSKEDDLFRLAVVTSALVKPKLTMISAVQFKRGYETVPVTYLARPITRPA